MLIEGISKKSIKFYYGRTTHNATVVFEKGEKKVGDYVNVKIKRLYICNTNWRNYLK